MRSARLITAALLCLGLIVPSAYGVVLCMDVHGGLSLKLAVDGACGGAQQRPTDGRLLDATEAGLAAGAAASCGGCRDVALGVGGGASRAVTGSAAKRLERPSGNAIIPAARSSRDCSLTESVSSVPGSTTAHGPHPSRTVVLQL